MKLSGVAGFPFSDCDLDWAWRCERMGLGTQAVIRSDEVVHDNRAVASAWSGDRALKLHRARLALIARYRGSWRANLIKPLLFLRHAAECVSLRRRSARGENGAADKLAVRRQMLRTVWRGYQNS